MEEHTMLNVGTKAPEFTLKDQNGNERSLSEWRGKRVILYFYPKDNTAGCTKEACSLRDKYEDFLKLNAIVVGISKDSVDSHKSFIAKQNLNFILLSDPDHKVQDEYQAWGEKKNYGRTYFGTIRCTYVIDENGVIEKTFPKVSVSTHGEDVLDYIKA